MSVRLMCENLINSSDLVSQTVSSEQTAFPDTNVYQGVRRSKVWRSNGYWEITSSNKVIIFRETVGVDLTATIVESNYTSDTTFLAAIKTALDAAGDSTYTVTRDSTTNKIKITSNGGGGGGVFQLRCNDAAFTAATTLGFSTASNLTGALTYTADTLKINTSEWLRWDFGISTNPEAFVLVGVRNSSIKISATATIKLQANATDVWTAPSVDLTLTYNDDAIVSFNTSGMGAYRYWRLLITDVSNSNGYVEVSKVYLGNIYVPARGGVQFPFKSRPTTRSTMVYSEGGQPFCDTRERGQTFDLDWNGLQKADIAQFETFWKNLAMHKPWFVCLDPDSAFSSNANYFTRMVRFADDNFTWQLISPDNFSSSMALREEL